MPVATAAITTTGSFPVLFRRGWSAWQKDLAGLIRWAGEAGFAGFDADALPPAELARIAQAGLAIGSVDLPSPWGELASPDAGKRAAAADRAAAYITAAVAACGALNFFIVLVPEDHARKRQENFRFAVDGLGRLCQGIAGSGARLVIEGWPGGGPHYSSLACTPADYRALLAELPAETACINFDPSHLVRMGIDSLRFLGEFAPRVRHVHGKDTEILADGLYEHGNLQPATFARERGFGGHHWRYCIPGHGQVRWTALLGVLAQAGYRGAVSIELEDERFNGSETGEKRGLLAARDFLTGV